MNIIVIGAGTWGTALSIVLNDNGHKVTLWHYKKDFLNQLESNKIHPKLNCSISSSINFTSNLENINNNDMVVIAIPTQTIRETFMKLNKISNKILFVNASKGIEVSSLKTISKSEVALSKTRKTKINF